MNRRFCLTLAAGLLLVAGPLYGQTWPTKPIRYIVPFPPAGATDILARWVGEKLHVPLGQQVLAHGTPTELPDDPAPHGRPEVRGADGHVLAQRLAGLL